MLLRLVVREGCAVRKSQDDTMLWKDRKESRIGDRGHGVTLNTDGGSMPRRRRRRKHKRNGRSLKPGDRVRIDFTVPVDSNGRRYVKWFVESGIDCEIRVVPGELPETVVQHGEMI